VFSIEDEYYARFSSDNADAIVVLDPINGIWKRLYSEEEIKQLLRHHFALMYFAKFEFSDVVLGKSYRRVLFTSVLRK
jgi:hypothetical protein